MSTDSAHQINQSFFLNSIPRYLLLQPTWTDYLQENLQFFAFTHTCALQRGELFRTQS